jgi:hypothetical protein
MAVNKKKTSVKGNPFQAGKKVAIKGNPFQSGKKQSVKGKKVAYK